MQLLPVSSKVPRMGQTERLTSLMPRTGWASLGPEHTWEHEAACAAAGWTHFPVNVSVRSVNNHQNTATEPQDLGREEPLEVSSPTSCWKQGQLQSHAVLLQFQGSVEWLGTLPALAWTAHCSFLGDLQMSVHNLVCRRDLCMDAIGTHLPQGCFLRS